MLDLQKLMKSLRNNQVEFFTGVPDSLLNEFCGSLIRELSTEQHVIAANEGNAVSLAAGQYLASGKVPLVYMQNSGIGNALNPLLSLTHRHVYSIPMILLIGWRGDPASYDWAQHKAQGAQTTHLLKQADIPYRHLEDVDEKIDQTIQWAVNESKDLSSPVALLVKKGTLEKGKGSQSFPVSPNLIHTRESAMHLVLQQLPQDTIYVATTGRASRELYELRKLRNENHDHDFLNIGSMGHASQIALGLSLAKRGRTVVCFDGDAATLMHLGALAVNGKNGGGNLIHIVLNNGAHESVGGQPSLGQKVSFPQIAAACGYKGPTKPVIDEGDLIQALQMREQEKSAPLFIDWHIRQGIRADMPKLIFSPQEQIKSLIALLKKD